MSTRLHPLICQSLYTNSTILLFNRSSNNTLFNFASPWDFFLYFPGELSNSTNRNKRQEIRALYSLFVLPEQSIGQLLLNRAPPCHFSRRIGHSKNASIQIPMSTRLRVFPPPSHKSCCFLQMREWDFRIRRSLLHCIDRCHRLLVAAWACVSLWRKKKAAF